MGLSMNIGLGLTARRGLPWTPAGLFALAEPGAWYDPSDMEGRLNWLRNLLTNTEDITAAVWVAQNGTKTSTDRFVPNTTAAVQHRLDYTVSSASNDNTFSVDLKADGYAFASLRINTSGAGFDLTTGATNTVSAGVTASSQSLGDGWWRCRVSLTGAPATVARVNAEDWAGMAGSFAGDGTKAIRVRKAQLETGSTATAYQPILSTADAAFLSAFPSHTLFQDSAGSTPVTTPGQTVGMVLDKSRGLVLGSELASVIPVPTIENSSGTVGVWSSATKAMTNTGVTISSYPRFNFDLGLTPGKTYYVRGLLTGNIAKVNMIRLANSGSANTVSFNATTGVFEGRIGAAASILQILTNLTSADAAIMLSDVSVKELPGAHLIQATAASRPTYGVMPEGGVRNLFLASEDFSSSGWVKSNCTASSDTITDNATANVHGPYQLKTVSGAGVFSITVEVAAGTLGFAQIGMSDNSTGDAQAFINLSTGAISSSGVSGGWSGLSSTSTAVGDGFHKVTVSATKGGSTAIVGYIRTATGASTSNYPGTGSGTIRARKAQMEAGSASAYQRVGATAFDVTESGKRTLHYLSFDGVDDGMATAANLDMSATDKVTVWAGVHKASDAATACVVELSALTTTTDGTFALWAPLGATSSNYTMRSRGTVVQDAGTYSYVAPHTAVLTGTGNISGDRATLRVNGSLAVTDVDDQGTGNYGSYLLYVGRRGGTTLPFNGRIYGLVIRGAATSDPGPGERWMAQRTGVSI